MAITKIKVENVKGAKNIEIIDKIFPNKPSLLVAPNGFGKTSITTAFLSLNANRLKLDEEHAHLGNPANKPKLTVQILGQDGVAADYHADEVSNTLSAQLDVHVINSKLRPKAVIKNMGKFSTGTARMKLDEIVLVNKIPTKATFGYSAPAVRREFGANGKCLSSIELDLQCATLASQLLTSRVTIAKFTGAKASAALAGIKLRINSWPGTAADVLARANAEVSGELEAVECVKSLADLLALARPVVRPRIELLLGAWQICELAHQDAARFKAACEYATYLGDKAAFTQLITAFDTTWKSVKPSEKGGRLVVDFPNPGMVSNGQRDSLSFAAQVQRVRQRIGRRDVLLIVDEIFDYLDDANLVAAQYYISNLIKEVKSRGIRIYPLIFTHLNPQAFRNYTFADQKVYFLAKSKAVVRDHMRRLILKREEIAVKDDISRCYLHHHPEHIDIGPAFQALGLLEAWGDSRKFHAFTVGEWRKYQKREDSYDPFAVSCYARVAIEKSVYGKIADPLKAQAFLDANGTTKKLQYAQSIGIEVPEVCFLLGVIYNQGLHYRDHIDNSSPIVSSLENVVIRQMLEEALRG